MPATPKNKARRRAAPRRKAAVPQGEVVFELPPSAVVTMRAGRTNVSLSADEYRQWLEDRLDIAESMAALADPSPRITWEEVKRKMGAK